MTIRKVHPAWQPGDPTEWRPIPGFAGYEVSNDGRVRSWRPHCGTPTPRLRKLRMHKGYQGLRLMHDSGLQVTRGVHVLVALAFLGERPAGLDVCHNDGNSRNNRPENLRYDTRSGNVQDMLKHGSHRAPHGEASPFAKLTATDVQEIRSRYAAGGVTHRSLATRFGVGHSTIGCIIRGTKWAHTFDGAA